MKPRELRDLVKHIRNSYGKNMVSEDVVDFLDGQLMHIPSEAVGWIKTNLVRRHQKCPEVLHIAVLDLWHAWRAENPDKCAADPYAKRDCQNSNCNGGWMTFWVREALYANAWVPFVVNCADCRRSRNTSTQALTMAACLQKGWEPDSLQIRMQRDSERGTATHVRKEAA